MKKVVLSLVLGTLLFVTVNGIVKASTEQVYYNYNFLVASNNGNAVEINNPYGNIQTDFAPRATLGSGEDLIGYNLYSVYDGYRTLIVAKDYALYTNASGLFTLGYASSSKAEVEVRAQNSLGTVAYKGWIGLQIFNSYN